MLRMPSRAMLGSRPSDLHLHAHSPAANAHPCSPIHPPPAQILATYWELPVSSTHTIVGAVVGMTMVAAGPDAVNWSERTGSFPFLGVSVAASLQAAG